MPLERQHTILFGPKPHRDADGTITRNKELMPCGCWKGDVYRSVSAPEGIVSVDLEGNPVGPVEGWVPQTYGCPTHSAAAAVIGLMLAEAVNGAASLANIGDGAKRLMAKKGDVLAEAARIDEELRALGIAPPSENNQLIGAARFARPELSLPGTTPPKGRLR